MKIIKYENYNTTPIPSEFIRVHCDGINYFFAENESDVAEIEASLHTPIIEEIEIPKPKQSMQTALLVALQTSYETLALLFVYGQLSADELIASQSG